MLAVATLASRSTAAWLRVFYLRRLRKTSSMCGAATHRAPSCRLGGFNEAVTLNAGSSSVGCVSEQPAIETSESEADSCADNQIVENPVEFLSTQDNGFVREIGGGFKVLGLETFEPKERTVALFTQLRGLLRNTKNTRWNTATLIFSFTRGGQSVDGLSEAHWL